MKLLKSNSRHYEREIDKLLLRVQTEDVKRCVADPKRIQSLKVETRDQKTQHGLQETTGTYRKSQKSTIEDRLSTEHNRHTMEGGGDEIETGSYNMLVSTVDGGKKANKKEKTQYTLGQQ